MARQNPPADLENADPLTDRSAVLQTCRALLRPIASLLLKCGMSWREFADLSKGVFVAAASADHGLNGRPTNVSRVSILTGMSRKEVVRVRGLLDQEVRPGPGKCTDATRLLAGWHDDPEFRSADGAPRVLPVDGPGPSFATLWQRYGGDVPVTSMRKELERAGAITALADGTVRPERRYFMPRRLDSRSILDAGSLLRDLGAGITHNLDVQSGAVASGSASERFIRRAVSDTVDVAALPEFEAFVEQNGQEFLERIDKWLADHAARPARGGARRQMRLGLGVFLIADDRQGV